MSQVKIMIPELSNHIPEIMKWYLNTKNSEYDQEIQQSHTADKPMASQGRASHNNRDTLRRQTKQSNQLSLPLIFLRIYTCTCKCFRFLNLSVIYMMTTIGWCISRICRTA